jgi:hypothetical protein
MKIDTTPFRLAIACFWKNEFSKSCVGDRLDNSHSSVRCGTVESYPCPERRVCLFDYLFIYLFVCLIILCTDFHTCVCHYIVGDFENIFV